MAIEAITHVRLPAQLRKQVDEAARRIARLPGYPGDSQPNRSEAIRALLRLGLRALEHAQGTTGG